ncbi:high mobility group nucleosome-binding domain-containing 3-like protein [Labeo rohita]|uniref:High mobility group nucleosome-binding domain-containing 3-like protein n=1 Tax=Labeo rohita TaxID=84645 RepID=A0A498MCN0_LABRO|nr:high mobility group nucleosome-binding domain-containing 3-like protein [Labeo rohita]
MPKRSKANNDAEVTEKAAAKPKKTKEPKEPKEEEKKEDVPAENGETKADEEASATEDADKKGEDGE